MAYFIVETKEQLSLLQKTDKCFIELVGLSEDNHPKLTSPCLLYYNDFQKGYILPINHSEAFALTIEDVQSFLESYDNVFLYDKKWHSYFLNLPKAVDVNLITSTTETVDGQCYTNLHNDFYNRFKYIDGVNALIPISKHYERCECMFELIRPHIKESENLPWQNTYIDVYKWVEEQGIKINERLFDKHYEPTWKARSIKDSKIYTSYNLYNVTSRPTNAFNGINFLAFNKENGSRAAFIPSNDVFVEFDFDAYHPRLIANLLNIDIPLDKSIHTHLGEYYFGKEELTEEEYQESKKITFRQLYNGVEDEVANIPLFKSVDLFVKTMWKDYQERGYTVLPNGKKLTQDKPSPQKLFNYYIQCLETVNNVKKLSKLKKLLEGKKSRVVLVVYDSILVDFAKQDGRELLDQIKEVLEEDGYIIKAQIGITYDFSN